MPRGNNTYKMDLEVDRKEITKLHLQGYSQHAIAAKVGRTQGSISKSLKAMREKLHKESMENMGEARAIQEARLEAILKEYWTLYNAESMEHPEQAMAGALKTVTELSKLLGVNMPTTQIIDQTVSISNEAPDPGDLAAKLASVFGTTDIVDGEVVADSVLPAPSDTMDGVEASVAAADNDNAEVLGDGVEVADSDPAPAPCNDPASLDPTGLAEELAAQYTTPATPTPPPGVVASPTSRYALRRQRSAS